MWPEGCSKNLFKETLESVSIDWQLNKSQPRYVTHACSWHSRGNVGVSLFFSDSIIYFLYWKFGQTRRVWWLHGSLTIIYIYIILINIYISVDTWYSIIWYPPSISDLWFLKFPPQKKETGPGHLSKKIWIRISILEIQRIRGILFRRSRKALPAWWGTNEKNGFRFSWGSACWSYTPLD